MPRQIRQQLMADAIARNRQVTVGGIVSKRQPLRGQPRLHLEATHIQQRTNHPPRPRINARQAGWSSPTAQPQQHGLRLIVQRMRDGHARRRARMRDGLQEGVSDGPPRVFKRRARARRFGTHIGAPRLQRQIEPRRDGVTERFVLVRIGPQLMIEVRQRHHLGAKTARDLREQVRQRHRVRPAGQTDNEAITPRNQALALASLTNPRKKHFPHWPV
jgi:hypothetical protein